MIKERPTLYAALVGARRARRSRSASPRPTPRSSDADARSASAARARAREHDLLGEREVPDDALYGVQTLRALENFPITGIAAARVSRAHRGARRGEGSGGARQRRARAARPRASPTLIVRAAQEIRAGRHHEHFVVDMIQGGAGTSTNMNANEVIANRALELLGQASAATTQSCTRTTTSTSASRRTTSIRRR